LWGFGVVLVNSSANTEATPVSLLPVWAYQRIACFITVKVFVQHYRNLEMIAEATNHPGSPMCFACLYPFCALITTKDKSQAIKAQQ